MTGSSRAGNCNQFLLIKGLILCSSLLFAALSWASEPGQKSEPLPQRLIVLTDIGNEPDDAESMVRLLTYTNEIEIEGLVAATSRHLPDTVNVHEIQQRVDAYEVVLGNLRVHDSRYPDASQLRERVVSGSTVYGMAGVGEAKDTEASQRIIEAVDKKDSRPVWIAIWGGAADLAQALWRVRDSREPDELQRFVAKLRVYSISDQDDAGPWIRAYFPELFWQTSVHGFSQYGLATWIGISAPLPGADPEPVSKTWLRKNIQSFGALGKLYPTPAYIMEGDTPSFLPLVANGLNMPERPDWGGWGGRYSLFQSYAETHPIWTNNFRSQDTVVVDGRSYTSDQATIWRWRKHFQHDFAARMDWCVADQYEKANHNPIAVLNGDKSKEIIYLHARIGDRVSFFADGSSDPDGDNISYQWLVYPEAGSYKGDFKLSHASGNKTSLTILPSEKFPPSTGTVHAILMVEDNGSPSLVAYRRAIITVE